MDEATVKVLAILFAQQKLLLDAYVSVLSVPDRTKPITEQFTEAYELAQEKLGPRTVAGIREQIPLLEQAVSATTKEEFAAAWRQLDALNQLFQTGLDELRRDLGGKD